MWRSTTSSFQPNCPQLPSIVKLPSTTKHCVSLRCHFAFPRFHDANILLMLWAGDRPSSLLKPLSNSQLPAHIRMDPYVITADVPISCAHRGASTARKGFEHHPFIKNFQWVIVGVFRYEECPRGPALLCSDRPRH